MQKVAIIHDPTSNHAHTWASWLRSADFQVDAICDEESFEGCKSIKYDLIIPLITIRDYVNKDSTRMVALTYFQSAGFKLLTPPSAITNSSDKLLTAQTLLAHSLPHPQTVLVEDFNWDNKQLNPIIIKPRFGHSGRGIYLARNAAEIRDQQNDSYLAQQFIKSAVCIRIITSVDEVLSAYKKVPPIGEVIANIDNGATRQPIALTNEMQRLAIQCLNALGGGLMGVDLLDSPEGLYILEANIPFGFDKSDNELRKNLVTFIHKEILLRDTY